MSVTPAFLDAYANGRLVSASKLNDGFVRPAYPQQVIFSYYEASLVCELIARDWGERAVVDMLRAYRAGASTDQVLRRVLHTDAPAFDRRFDAYVRERFGDRLASLQSYRDLVGQGRRLMAANDTGGARAVLERARALFPEYTGAEGAYPQLARLALAGGDRARAAAILATMVTEGESPADVHRTLAKLLLEQGDTTRAADALERLMFVDPYTVEDHAQLAALYDRLGDRRRVVRERRAVVALNPVDRADALYLLALAYRAAGDTVNARHSVIQSLEQAPHFERAQELLLALHEAAQTAPASQGKKP